MCISHSPYLLIDTGSVKCHFYLLSFFFDTFLFFCFCFFISSLLFIATTTTIIITKLEM